MSAERESVICAICRRTIWSGSTEPIVSRASMPSRSTPDQSGGMLTAMMIEAERAHQEKLATVEAACLAHFQSDHALRWRIAHFLRWEGLMARKWPWTRRSTLEKFEVRE